MSRFIGICLAATLLFAAPAWAQIQPAATPPSQTASGTFATKPAPSAGALYFATDLGTHGVLLASDGTVWKPASGSAVIAQSGVAATVTGVTIETALANIAVPAGLLSANGSLRVTCLFALSTTTSDTTHIRFSASTGITGTSFLAAANSNTVTASRTQIQISNLNSTSSQIGQAAGLGAFSLGAQTLVTSAIATSSASFINITALPSNTTDTATLDGYTVEWLEP